MKNLILIVIGIFNMSMINITSNNSLMLSNAALERTEHKVQYNGQYERMEYPNGDIVDWHGVCTDVVIRSYRNAYNIDLQKLIHEDMVANFEKYPNNWGLTKPDSNIDHRRTQNQECFFKRKGASVPITSNPSDYKPGDLVYWGDIGNGHVGIVVDVYIEDCSEVCRPMVVHNIGSGPKCEDFLFKSRITGHYRFIPNI